MFCVLRRCAASQRHHIELRFSFEIREDIALLQNCDIILTPIQPQMFQLMLIDHGVGQIADQHVDRRAFDMHKGTFRHFPFIDAIGKFTNLIELTKGDVQAHAFRQRIPAGSQFDRDSLANGLFFQPGKRLGIDDWSEQECFLQFRQRQTLSEDRRVPARSPGGHVIAGIRDHRRFAFKVQRHPQRGFRFCRQTGVVEFMPALPDILRQLVGDRLRIRLIGLGLRNDNNAAAGFRTIMTQIADMPGGA